MGNTKSQFILCGKQIKTFEMHEGTLSELHYLIKDAVVCSEERETPVDRPQTKDKS